jgi:RHS repeat-associated protein
VNVLGEATNTATVLVNNAVATRKGTYFRAELAVTNSGPLWAGITNLAVLNQGTNADIIATNAGSLLVPAATETFTHDADGNLTSDSLWTNVWNAENRRITIESRASVPTAGKVKEQWTYLPDGRWIERIVSTNNGSSYAAMQTNRFVWDGNVLLAVLNGTNGLELAFLRGLDLSGSLQGAGGVGGLLAVQVGPAGPAGLANTTHFAASDGNGNVAALVNATDGTESARYEYGPFAEPLRMTGVMGKVNPIRFSTQYEDDFTGDLKYLYRDLRDGRWPNRDPIEEEGGLNVYVFSANDGINYIDPVGEAYFNFTLSFGALYVSGGVDDQNLHFEAGGSAVPKPLEKLTRLWNRSSWRRYHIGTLQAQLSIFGSVDLTLNGLDKNTKACINAQLVFALIKQQVTNGRFDHNDNWGIGIYGSGAVCLYPCTGDIMLEYEGSYFVKFGNGGTKKNWKDWFNIGGKLDGKERLGNWSWLPQKLACHCKK